MKRIVALVLAMVMVLSLAACGGSSAPIATTASAASGDAAPAAPAAAEKNADSGEHRIGEGADVNVG